MEKSVEWLAGETEVLGENLLQCRFVHHKPHMLPVREPGPGKPASNRWATARPNEGPLPLESYYVLFSTYFW
jgi:hypothetical protein